MDVFAALANQDRLTDCLAAAGCLATARLVCRGLRDLVDGGVKAIKLTITHRKAGIIERDQPLAALLRRWDRCQDLTVELLHAGGWDPNGARFLAMPQWLFAGVPSGALARIQAFNLSTHGMYKWPDVTRLVSALAAHMPALRHLDLSGCSQGNGPPLENTGADLICASFTALAATCPQLETLSLPWDAPLSGVEALAGSLVRLRVGTDDDTSVIMFSNRVLSAAELQSISQLEHLREVSFKGLLFNEGLGLHSNDGDITKSGSQLLRVLDSLPPSVELLDLLGLSFFRAHVRILFGFRDGQLSSVDVKDGCLSLRQLWDLGYALLRCRAAGEGVGADPQRRPFVRIRTVTIGCDEAVNVTELGPLRERFSLAPLDAISFESQKSVDPGVIARRVGGIVSAFGLPRELWSQPLLRPLQLRQEDASTPAGAPAVPAAAAITVNATHTSRAAAVTDEGVAAVSSPAAAPAPHGEGSSQTGGSAAPVALYTAGAEDVLRLAAERLWVDKFLWASAGVQPPGTAGSTAADREPGRIVMLHVPCGGAAEWGKIRAGVDAELIDQLKREDRLLFCSWEWRFAGPRFAMAMCNTCDTAAELMASASSPDGPCVREGIQVTRLRAGAVKYALQQVLLELWRGSANTSLIMSQQGRRVGRLVELLVEAGGWCQWEA